MYKNKSNFNQKLLFLGEAKLKTFWLEQQHFINFLTKLLIILEEQKN